MCLKPLLKIHKELVSMVGLLAISHLPRDCHHGLSNSLLREISDEALQRYRRIITLTLEERVGE